MLNPEEARQYAALRDIVARLRAPDGCPWDREQTHQSLRRYVIEEAFEVAGVLDSNDIDALPEELGDLLIQVLLHTQIAEEMGEFTMLDVLRGLADKLVRRHPHVFGDSRLETADQVNRQWDELKRAERAEDVSALASVPRAMPALAYAQTLLRRAERAGFAWPHRQDVIEKVTEELEELANVANQAERKAEFGDLLLNIANYARYLDIDAEEALREASQKFRRRFEGVESRVRAAGEHMQSLSREQLIAHWDAVKAGEREPPGGVSS